ncbi:2-methylcitrate dehydratase [Jaminaea rosea]|uniref:2-methylcitrate dehydratase n=1 Tax=Jaminaea rosea TaxID=1569628 RepID=A0A316UJM4_9BASI|nr:2-methylcitrate dehydratase [Jaminaea rosea]PWN25477.1 2-methylcitrate dehydratase [Jaminaea rosea]
MAGGVGLGEDNARPDPDQVVQQIADYVHNYQIKSDVAYDTARLDLFDTLGCGMEALRFPQARSVLGPVVPGTEVPNGAHVPGTPYVLDPIRAAFNTGAMIRWLDFNDTWLAAEWGHPSDNLGAILSVADWLSRTNIAKGKAPLTVHDVLTGMIKAHEIQGVIALENSFNRVGLDHVLLVKLASAAVVSQMIGNTRDQTVDTITQALVDGQSLRTYRHAPNAGSRKSWAAGDACSRAVNLALLVQRGEGGYPSVLTAKTWGFYDVLFKGKPFKFTREYGSYVMEHVLFKLASAEYHSQTSVEAAMTLHKEMKAAGKTVDDIKKITIRSTEATIRIISKQGKLNNFADRDHCIQYMTAVPLIEGYLDPQHYTDEYAAANPKIDELRAKTYVEENEEYSAGYLDPERRSIANDVEIEFNDGSKIRNAVEYPVGHARRREEAKPLIKAKLEKHLKGQFANDADAQKIVSLLNEHDKVSKMAVNDFVDLWKPSKLVQA